jgi:putative hydrolase of the HAD superfamily
MTIKAIFFDVDNTIIDFMKMKHECCEAAIDSMIGAGLEMKRESALKLLYNLYDKYGIEYQKIFQKFTKIVKGKIDYRIISYGILAYRKMRESYLIPYARAVPTILALRKNYKLAIVSDAPIMEAWMRLVTMKVDNFFDVVITKGDVRKQKTTAAPFRAALRALDIKPHEAIMIGDRIVRDVNTAKKLGLHTVYARYGDNNPPKKGESGADFEIGDISELIEVVNKLSSKDN